MKLEIKYLLFLLLMTIAQFGCDSSSVKSQTTNSSSNTVTGYEPVRPKDEGRVVGEFERAKLDKATEETIKQQPAPRFFLIFQCSNDETNCTGGERRQNLPVEAQKLVDDYWKQLLDYGYEMLTDRRKDIDFDTYNRLINKQEIAATKFENSMRKITVVAPNGKRELSENEVSQIMLTSNDKVCQTVQQSDKCVQENPK